MTTCPKCSATSGGDWSQCGGSCPMPTSPHYDRRDPGASTKHAFPTILPHAGLRCRADQLCLQSHYAAIVEASKDIEIYRLGDVDCASCLRIMAEKHEAIAELFRVKLAALGGPT